MASRDTLDFHPTLNIQHTHSDKVNTLRANTQNQIITTANTSHSAIQWNNGKKMQTTDIQKILHL